MKTVLIIAFGEFYPFKGGIATYVDSLIQALHTTTKITVLATADNRNTKYPLPSVSIKKIRYTQFRFIQYFLGNIATIVAILRYRPDHILITHPEALFLSQWLLRWKSLFGKTHVSYILYGTELADIEHGKGYLRKNNFSYVLKKIDTVIVISEYTHSLFKKHFSHHDIQLLYPTISQDFINAKSEEIKEKNNSYILSIGRLVKRKGHETVIPYLKKFPGLKYVIVGDGPERNHLTAVAKEYGVENQVILSGKITEEEKKGYIDRCLFLMQPSVDSHVPGQQVEGFGISILEAFSRNKTAIVYDHGGMKEIVNDSQNGYIIDQLDTQRGFKLISQLLNDSTLKKTREKYAADTYKEMFAPDVFKKKLYEILSL